MHDLTEPFLRLLAATVVGTVIGINRDLYGKPTGVRLHALVSIASALLVMLAGELGSGTPDHAAASRIIQGIVGGIGFLGAGVILRADKGNRVYHITTAATIWVTAALGTACGLGAWRVAALASVLVLVVLTLGLRLDRVLFRHGEPDEDIGPSWRSALRREYRNEVNRTRFVVCAFPSWRPLPCYPPHQSACPPTPANQ